MEDTVTDALVKAKTKKTKIKIARAALRHLDEEDGTVPHWRAQQEEDDEAIMDALVTAKSKKHRKKIAKVALKTMHGDELDVKQEEKELK